MAEEAKNQHESRSKLFHVGFLQNLFFYSEDGGDMFLRNVGKISAGYTALYPIE
jgi:hypothetical protein